MFMHVPTEALGASLSDNLRLRNGDDIFASAPSVERCLLHQFWGDIPRKKQDIVYFLFLQLMGTSDRNSRSWCEFALLFRGIIRDEADEIVADAKIVQQGVAFRRGSVPRDCLALALEVLKKIFHLLFHLVDTARKIKISFFVVKPVLFLKFKHLAHAAVYGKCF